MADKDRPKSSLGLATSTGIANMAASAVEPATTANSMSFLIESTILPESYLFHRGHWELFVVFVCIEDNIAIKDAIKDKIAVTVVNATAPISSNYSEIDSVHYLSLIHI